MAENKLKMLWSCVKLPCKPDVRWLPVSKTKIKTRSKTNRDEDNTSYRGLIQKNRNGIVVYLCVYFQTRPYYHIQGRLTVL